MKSRRPSNTIFGVPIETRRVGRRKRNHVPREGKSARWICWSKIKLLFNLPFGFCIRCRHSEWIVVHNKELTNSDRDIQRIETKKRKKEKRNSKRTKGKPLFSQMKRDEHRRIVSGAVVNSARCRIKVAHFFILFWLRIWSEWTTNSFAVVAIGRNGRRRQMCYSEFVFCVCAMVLNES